MTLGGAISYEEPYGSFTISFGKYETVATRLFKIDWDDLSAFLIELKGGYRDAPGNPWTEPARLPGFDYLYCVDAISEGLGVGSQSSGIDGDYIKYEYAKITARYELLSIHEGRHIGQPDSILEESIRISGQLITLPDGSFVWRSDDKPVNEQPGKLMPSMEYNITRPGGAQLNQDTILSLVGSVNDDVWRGFAAGKVLFLGAEANKTTTTDGGGAWRTTYSFLIRTIAHNYFFRPGKGAASAWELIIQAPPPALPADDVFVYDKGDFEDLDIYTIPTP